MYAIFSAKWQCTTAKIKYRSTPGEYWKQVKFHVTLSVIFSISTVLICNTLLVETNFWQHEKAVLPYISLMNVNHCDSRIFALFLERPS